MTDPERLQAAVDEALEFLGRTGTQTAEREQLAKRVVDRGDAKVRKQLGDAIYDLARRCIQVHERTRAGVTFGMRGPGSTAELNATIAPLADRAAVARRSVETLEPSPSSSAPLKSAVDVLERLEGRSDAWRLMTAWEALAREDLGAALVACELLAKSGSTAAWRWAGTQTATKCLIQLNRLADARRALDEFARTEGENDATLFNMACVHALQGNVSEFERCASAVKNCPRKTAEWRTWSEMIESQVAELCAVTGRTEGEIRKLFGLEPHDA